MKAVLVGNYGVGNFGDEALKEYFLSAYPEVSWTVLTAKSALAEELPRLPIGLRSFFGTTWLKTVGAIRHADAVVFGGGTLFTDIESVKACVLWGVHALVARLFGVPVFLAFQGIGPFKTRFGEAIARWVVRCARYVSVRDVSSMERVRSWQGAMVEQTFDPVFLSFVRGKREGERSTFVLIPRHNSGRAFLQALEPHARALRDTPIVVALFQPDDARERRVVETLRRHYPQASVRTIRTIDDLMTLLSTAAFCVCERFHGALAAVAAGAPLMIVSQAEGDKLESVRSLVEKGGIGDAVAAAERGESSLRTALSGIAS